MPFDVIPTDFSTPGVYVKNSNGTNIQTAVAQPKKALIIGQRTSDGSAAALTLKRIVSDTQGAAFHGPGSLTSELVTAFRKVNKTTELWSISMADDGDGVKAAFTLTFTGTTTSAGILYFLMGEKPFQVSLPLGSTPTQTATKVTAAIQAATYLPAVSTSNLGVSTVTMKNAGEFGNDYKITLNYFQGQDLPAGLSVAIAQSVQGEVNPDITTALAALGGDQWNYIISPYNDTTNVVALEAYLGANDDPVLSKEGVAFLGLEADLADAITYGNARNSKFTSFHLATGSPDPSWFWAAERAGIRAGQSDPAANVNGIRMVDSHAPKPEDRFDPFEWNSLIDAGFSYYRIAPDSTVLAGFDYTMYKKDDNNIVDERWKRLHKVIAASYIRWFWGYWYNLRWGNAKLAPDTQPLSSTQKIITPRIGKAEDYSIKQILEREGIIVNIAASKDSDYCEIDPNVATRMNHLVTIEIIDHLEQTAVQAEYN